ncbi:MAG TPA: NADH-quinone oxidoreductase subunit C [Kiritimatiellia bacterium]|nr:NADH-quinone oxidoreductase subunit C [Kiritimatiellia bacterium]HMO99985.1 NADH-quinone oxidoreductase subunit C [Kiritimatiellia bacterium]HMP96928.1 NADH-quinone oxidoreductase subunit C [Kiritimatiellia bacterium]
MIPQQVIHEIEAAELVARVEAYRRDDWRLVQICATTLDHYQMSYSFTLDQRFEHLRVKVALEQPALPSITGVYFGAFAYENEIHDLFGIRFDGLKLDYCGNFFKLQVNRPFASSMCVIKEGA